MRHAFEAAAVLVGVAAVAWLSWTFGWTDLVTALSHATPAYLLAYLGCGCAVRLGYALRWHAVAATLGGAPSVARCVAARVAGDAVGSLFFTGRIAGDPLRVALVVSSGAGASRATAGVTIDRLIEVISNMVCAATYVTLFWYTHALGASQRPAAVLVVSLLCLLGALAIPLALLRRGVRPLTPLYRLRRRRPKWVDALWRTEGHVMQFFREHPGTFIWGLVGSLIIEACIIGEYHFLLETFGLTIGLPVLLMALVTAGLAHAVPTPAGLGAVEAGQVALLAVATGQPDVGFVLGMLIRLHETLWLGVGAIALLTQGVSLARLRVLASTGKVVA